MPISLRRQRCVTLCVGCVQEVPIGDEEQDEGGATHQDE